MISRSRILAVAAAVLSSVILVACGDLEDEGGGDNRRGELTQGETMATVEDVPQRELPPRPDGVVQIDGAVDGSLTDPTIERFGKQTGGTGLALTADVSRSDETAGFEALCNGLTDIVDSSRDITPQELETCDDNNLQVVQFKIAFDATVVATRNERDVGADCVNFDQLRLMYGAGSSVNSWNQLNPNFFALQLVPIGPTEESTDFQFFGSRVLLDPDPTLGTYRSDYQPYEKQQEIRKQINPNNPPGWVGIVSFSFYELFEDKLRPLEIDGQTGDRCVFPSTETISTESYPLERTLSLFTTQRSLNRQEVQQFLAFYINGAEELANNNELVPISDSVRQQQINRLTNPDAFAPVEPGQVSEPSPDGTLTTVPTTTTTSTGATTTGLSDSTSTSSTTDSTSTTTTTDTTSTTSTTTTP